jgi:deoxyadenosine/deoxycytidine kinase
MSSPGRFVARHIAPHIAVEGPIGVGKTAFATLLADRLGARTVFEQLDNPFLDRFYEDPRRLAFQAQVYFLLSRYRQKDELLQQDLFARGGVVSDFVFARDRIFAQLNLSRDELALYEKLYGMLGTEVRRPDLVVYLQARPEILVERCRKAAGKSPPPGYISQVAEAYAEFFFSYSDSPLLVVNTSEIDFVSRREDLDDLVAVIQRVIRTRVGVSHYSPLGSR